MKILFLTLLFAVNIYAAEFSCGDYQFLGTAEVVNDNPIIIVNKKTASEYRFNIPIEEEPIIAAYIGRHFEMTATLNEKINGTKGKLKKIRDLKLRINDPLAGTENTGLKLLTKLDCIK
jgi:hypothetical protein